MVAGSVAEPKVLASLAREKEGLVERYTHPKHAKVWEADWSLLRKHWGVSHTQANTAPEEQRNLLMVCWTEACTQMADLPVLSMTHVALATMWTMTSRRKSFSLSCPPGDVFASVFV